MTLAEDQVVDWFRRGGGVPDLVLARIARALRPSGACLCVGASA